MTEESNVTPIAGPEVKVPEETQKQIQALKAVTLCHNVLTQASHGFQNFDAAAQSLIFLGSLHADLSAAILKCPEAASLPDMKPLFDRQKKAAELEAAAKEAEKIESEGATVTPIAEVPVEPKQEV